MIPESIDELAQRLQVLCEPPPGVYELCVRAVIADQSGNLRTRIEEVELEGYPIPFGHRASIDFSSDQDQIIDYTVLGPTNYASPPKAIHHVTVRDVLDYPHMGLFRLHPCPWPDCERVSVLHSDLFFFDDFGRLIVPHQGPHAFCESHADAAARIRKEHGLDPSEWLSMSDDEREQWTAQKLDEEIRASDAETGYAIMRLLDSDYSDDDYDDLCGML